MTGHLLFWTEGAVEVTDVGQLNMNTLQGELDQFAKTTGKFFGGGLNLSQHELVIVGINRFVFLSNRSG